MTMPELNNGYHHNPWSVPGESPSAFGYSSTGQEPMSPHKGESSPHHSVTNGYSSDQHSDTEDGPTYLLEHLATFSVGRTHSITDPMEGLNKLWQMEKRTGIWTQKMQMRLLKQQVVIIDFENGDVVERFPMNLITSPMAYTGTDNKEPYNNILVFIVKEEPKVKNLNNSEMHIFQCVQKSAQIIVEDMKLFMAGKWKSPYKKPDLPPPPKSPAPEPPINGVKQQASMSMLRSSPAYNTRDSIDETSSTSSEKYEKEVGILNHCFDDIEQFIAWLQSAAAAYRELERRRKDRKNKKKDHGDGMLKMRAKPPPENDFIDVLQKFKLSFNLLAKLKNHIHDPNAPELVHFLFTPLALIVDASQDSNYGTNLASRVVSPLLTKEAVELLGNCLTSKESDLWHSLGEPWVVSRDQYKGYVEHYRPTFRDGYSPDYPFNDEKEKEYSRSEQGSHNDYPTSYYNADPSDQPSSPEDRRRVMYLPPKEREVYHRPPSPHSEQEYVSSNISADSIERMPTDPQRDFERHQQQYLEELKARRAKIVQVIFPRTANNDKELSVFRGEFLEILDDNRRWWKARNSRDQVAHVPHTIVTPIHMDDEVVFSNPLYDGPGREMYRQDSSRHSTDGSTSGDLQSAARPPPIPPPTPTPAPQDWRQKNIGKRVEVVKTVVPVEIEPVKMPPPPKLQLDPETSAQLQKEIQNTLRKELYKKKNNLSMPKLSPMQINEFSTEYDVQVFLQAKDFDSSIQKILSGMDGYKMFHLTKDNLEKYCGKEEGSRLNSQLELQKSLCGYCTMKFKELDKILHRRYLKVEEAIEEAELNEKWDYDDKITNGEEKEKAENQNSKKPSSPSLPPVRNSFLDSPNESDDDDRPTSSSNGRMQKKQAGPPPPPPPK